MNKFIFISWEKHQRTRSMCSKLNIPLFEVTSKKKGLNRYIDLILKTVKVLNEEKPKTLFIQNPSIILSSLAVFLKYFFKYTLIIDAHNEAIEPFIHNNFLVRFAARMIISLTDRTLVTNDSLAKKVSLVGGKPIVLPDFLPNIEPRDFLTAPDNRPWEITLICTYANDEPYQEVFEAVAELDSHAILNVTGKIPTKLNRATVPVNVKLSGFLSEHDYWETLFKSHIVIDLTTMENCLVCGAYEALAIEKPTLLSTNQASKHLFGSSAHHVDNTVADIKSGLQYLIKNYAELGQTIPQAKLEFLHKEELRINELITIIE